MTSEVFGGHKHIWTFAFFSRSFSGGGGGVGGFDTFGGGGVIG